MFLYQLVIAKNQRQRLFSKSLLCFGLLMLVILLIEAVLDQVLAHDQRINYLLDLTCAFLLALIGALIFMTYVDRTTKKRNRADKEREIMLAGISHDLRTPLTRMRLEIELSGMSDHAKSAIDQDLIQVEHTLAQLMTYAKPSRLRSTAIVDLSDSVLQFIESEKFRWKGLDIKLATRITRGVRVRMNHEDIVRVLTNLVDNAMRYGRDKGGTLELYIGLQRTDALAFLEISDRGPGITPEETENLLRPFVRGSQNAAGAASAGLGLAIVERLLRRVNAELNLIPRDGGGLTAQICLACVESMAASKATTEAAIPS